jgi:hypothetical protein
MKTKILFFVLICGVIVKNYGQGPNGKIHIGGSINYAFLGAGDYSGVYYSNSFFYSIKPSFQISGSLGFLFSSNDGKEYIYRSHNNAYLLGDLTCKIVPVTTKIVDMFFEIGFSGRHRSELEVQSVFTINNKTTVNYSNEESYDIGYLGLIGFGFKITSKTMILLKGELHSYNKGTGISSFGLGINLRL